MDATVVSPLHVDGTHRRKADTTDGQALAEARKHKERTYPELCRGNGRARLVVIAGEVGGRWSPGNQGFLVVFGKCEGCLCSQETLRERTACSRAKSVASSLLGVRGSPGAGDQVPSVNKVLAEARHGF